MGDSHLDSTDTAFAVVLIVLLSDRVPVELRVLVTRRVPRARTADVGNRAGAGQPIGIALGTHDWPCTAAWL
jgi:hypothetical protein